MFHPAVLKATETALFQRVSYMEPGVCASWPPGGPRAPLGEWLIHTDHHPSPRLPLVSPPSHLQAVLRLLPLCYAAPSYPTTSPQRMSAAPSSISLPPFLSPSEPCVTLPWSDRSRLQTLRAVFQGPSVVAWLGLGLTAPAPCFPPPPGYSLEIPMVGFQKDATLRTFGPSV